MKILLVYGTTEGQTRKIFQFLKDQVEMHGHKADLADATDIPPKPDAYDAVIIGGSLHMGKYQGSVKHYILDNVNELNHKITALVSVSLSVASHEEESLRELEKITQKFLENTGWKPQFIEQVAGALKFTKYNWLKKFIMRLISKKEGGDTDTSGDYEYTNWEEVSEFLNKLLVTAEKELV